MKKILALSLMALMLSTACSAQTESDAPELTEQPVEVVLNQEPVEFPSYDPSSDECAGVNKDYEYMYGMPTEWSIVDDVFYRHRQSDLALFFAYLACDSAEVAQEKFTNGMTSGKVYVAFEDAPDPELEVLLSEMGFTFHEDRYDGYQVYVQDELVEIMSLEPLKNYYPYFSSSWGDVSK